VEKSSERSAAFSGLRDQSLTEQFLVFSKTYKDALWTGFGPWSAALTVFGPARSKVGLRAGPRVFHRDHLWPVACDARTRARVLLRLSFFRGSTKKHGPLIYRRFWLQAPNAVRLGGASRGCGDFVDAARQPPQTGHGSSPNPGRRRGDHELSGTSRVPCCLGIPTVRMEAKWRALAELPRVSVPRTRSAGRERQDFLSSRSHKVVSSTAAEPRSRQILPSV